MKLPGVALLIVLSACGGAAPQWQGWIYPDRSDLEKDVPLGKFSSLDECRASAPTVIANFDLRDTDGEKIESDFECGRSCRKEGGPGGLMICAETSH